MRDTRPAHALTLRGLLLLLVVALVGSAAAVAGQVLPDPVPAAAATTTFTTSITCGTDDAGIAAALRKGPELCAHEDEPPAGVDVAQPIATAELARRDGAGEEAAAAAAGAGVVTAAAAGGQTVECDGNGSSGFRVQAMYVVEAGKTNRWSAMVKSFRTWAAGVDDVVNRSAALTGGVRHVRFVTEKQADGTCVPSVLSVTVPAGSTVDLGRSSAALAKLGYDAKDRRYLSWTDASVYCGIAWMYTDSKAGQSNANNGGYTSYARVDQSCWGLSPSVEAHEVTHTLGAVQPDAPHATRNGHCTDESDRMCYVDGDGVKMTQVCEKSMEALLDCGADDYFSTDVKSGTYLASHWNAADSRFLIGGGDGTSGAGGNTSQRPTVTVQANAMVPGLPTQVAATVTPADGRDVASIAFAPSAGCTLAGRNAKTPQATVTCRATTTAAAVTVTAKDDAGSATTVRQTLTLDRTARPVTVKLLVNRAAYNAAAVCATTGTLTGVVVDQATGTPVTGLPVTFRRGSAKLASVATGADGRAAAATKLSAAAFTATASGAAAFKTTATTDGTLRTTTCKGSISTKPASRSVKSGKKIAVSGKLLATPTKGRAVAAAGGKVVVTVQPKGGKAVTLGTATATADGSWTVAAAPKVSGTVIVTAARTPVYSAATAKAGTVTVR